MTFAQAFEKYINTQIDAISKRYKEGYIPLVSDIAERDVYGFFKDYVKSNKFEKEPFLIFVSEMMNNAVREKQKAITYNDKLYWYVTQRIVQNIFDSIKEF